MRRHRAARREALALIDRHGDQAAIHAAMEADATLEDGDLDGAARRRLVVVAINVLRDLPAGTVH